MGLGNNFLDLTSKAQATKVKIDQWDSIQIKNFCMAKKKINKMKNGNGNKYLQTMYPVRD